MKTTDQLLALAQMAGDLVARLDRMEQQFATQSISLNAADKALAASLDGLRSLDAAALEARGERLVGGGERERLRRELLLHPVEPSDQVAGHLRECQELVGGRHVRKGSGARITAGSRPSCAQIAMAVGLLFQNHA